MMTKKMIINIIINIIVIITTNIMIIIIRKKSSLSSSDLLCSACFRLPGCLCHCQPSKRLIFRRKINQIFQIFNILEKYTISFQKNLQQYMYDFFKHDFFLGKNDFPFFFQNMTTFFSIILFFFSKILFVFFSSMTSF